MAEEAKAKYKGCNQREDTKTKTTKQGEGKSKKGRKVRTQTWSDVVKGLNKDDELETANLDKSRNGSEITDSFKQIDSNKLNQLKAKRMKGQQN
mgnify:CR=1 FL=1